MPLLDLPQDQLTAYAGRNPRPQDFDTFWDQAVARIRTINPCPELIPAAFTSPMADCYHLWFTSTGGARVHAKLLLPRGATAVPAVLQFHGFRNFSGDWQEKLGLVAEGWCVAALDCRGQGGLSQDGGILQSRPPDGQLTRGLLDEDPWTLGYVHHFLDTAMLAQVVAGLPQVDATRMAAMGNSQGGGLALACAALVPEIRRVAIMFPFLCDWKRVWEMDLAKDAYGELRDFFRRQDPQHLRAEEFWTRLGYIDVAHLAPRIRAEVLMGVGLMDAITPPSTQFAAYNRITSPKRAVFYPDFGHEALPGFSDMAHEFLRGLR